MADEFCLKIPDFHVTFRDLLHAVNLRYGTDGITSPPKEGVLRIFSPWKIQRLRSGLNPRTWVPKASKTTEATLQLSYKYAVDCVYLNSIIGVVTCQFFRDVKCVTGYFVPDVSRQRSGFIFKGRNVQEESLEASGAKYAVTQCHITEELISDSKKLLSKVFLRDVNRRANKSVSWDRYWFMDECLESLVTSCRNWGGRAIFCLYMIITR